MAATQGLQDGEAHPSVAPFEIVMMRAPPATIAVKQVSIQPRIPSAVSSPGPLRPSPQVLLERLGEAELKASLNEASVMARICHPRIVEFFGSKVQQGALFIAMEYAPGGDLAAFIARHAADGEPVDEPSIWRLGIQVLEGLAHLASLRILHRDLKPANVLLDARGDAKLADLGLSRALAPPFFEKWASCAARWSACSPNPRRSPAPARRNAS